MNAVRRSLWLTMADSYFGVVLQLISTVIISRVLTPKEVGIYAVAAVFSGLASMFRDFGVAEYMIQEKELSNDKIAAALTLNIAVSWSMALAMVLGAPYAAAFYKDAGIGAVMRVQALGFLMIPFGAVTMAYFRRQLNFRPVLICNVAANVTSFAIAVTLVLLGFGYMSMAWASVAAIAVSVCLGLWFRPAHFPRWPGLKGVGAVFGFSKFVSSIYIVGQIGKGAPEMVIGRAESVVEVAMFSRAGGLVEIAQRLLLRPVHFICMPYFAQSQRDGGTIADAYIKSVSFLTAVGWPFLAFMGLAAFPAMRMVYGPQWDAAVPLAQILCAACCLELVHLMSREALLARGLARQANSLQMGLLLLQGLGLAAVVPFGLVGAAWGMLAAAACGLVLSQWFLARGIGLRAGDLLRACLPSLAILAGALAPAALWAVLSQAQHQQHVLFGLGGAALTAGAWLLMLHSLRHPLMAEIHGLIGKLRKKPSPQNRA
jgi:O-antigen/teichoic acid export membrane protein